MADGEHYTTLESNDIVRYSYASAAPGESMLPRPRRTSSSPTTPSRPTSGRSSLPRAASRSTAIRTPPAIHSCATTPCAPSCATPKRRATPPSRPTGRRSPTRPQRSLRLRHRLPDHAPHHRRRGVERGDQRHDRLGLRGGVRRNAGLRLLARQPPHRLPAFRLERSAADGDDALRRQTLQQGLFIQIPQGRGAQPWSSSGSPTSRPAPGSASTRAPKPTSTSPASGGRPTDGPGTFTAQPPRQNTFRNDSLRTPTERSAHGLRGAAQQYERVDDGP